MAILVIKSKTTSCALDPMPTKLVKENTEKLLPLLTRIINRSIASGEFPHKWKTALVVSMLKKAGDILFRKTIALCQISNMCPNSFCLQSECGFPSPPCQSAYRAGHSTETALVKVQSDMFALLEYQAPHYIGSPPICSQDFYIQWYGV